MHQPVNSSVPSQTTLFEESTRTNIVNVASVPQRSPFRYPGGKTWLVPTIRQWMRSREQRPTIFIEPFAGGGIASLTVAFEKLADKAIMVELDEGVAAVWKTVLDQKDAEWLGEKITSYELTRDGCEKDIALSPNSIRERAFLTILRNRVCRGGIMAPGAGFIEYGENGKGVHSRWYPQTLKRRISEIAHLRNRIRFIHGDAFEVMKQYSECENAIFFIDPPYTASKKKAGSRLYNHFAVDHARLFREAASVRGEVLLTYDNAEEITELAESVGMQTKAIPMKNNHHAEMTELLIGKDLSWVTL